MEAKGEEPRGSLAELRELMSRIPTEQARAVREVAQKELEADVRAHDALLARANSLLAASGVALSLLVGLSKEVAINSSTRRWLFAVALLAAAGAVLLVILCLRVATSPTSTNSKNVVGASVTEPADKVLWGRDYELSLALAYLDLRMDQAARHRCRATLLAAAQWAYVVFLILVCALGVAIAV